MPDDLEQGRESYRRRAWNEAYRSLARADRAEPLGDEDLERLAVAAYLVGHDADFLAALERAHQAQLDSGRVARAARCAFWIGLRLLLRGESGPASGWLGRARRVLDRAPADCVERGYLELPAAEQKMRAGDLEAAHALATAAFETGERFNDADLTAAAQHVLGRILVRQERTEEGLAMLDEAMVAVTAGELSPIMTGLIYCSVIDACRQVFALGRAREWTGALARWCEDQPEMVAFTGPCLVQRAAILQLQGAWSEAQAEVERACERFARGIDPERPAAALYQRAELHRLRGEFAAAEEAYRASSQWGREPQPGLALLRLAQGRIDDATAAMRRVESATSGRLERVKLLPAYVEVMLAAGDLEAATRATDELETIAASLGTGAPLALAAGARGAVLLVAGDAQAAVASLRIAWNGWQSAEAPYMAARIRVLIAQTCRDLGDTDGAALELEAARATFKELEARPDLDQLDALRGTAATESSHGLSPRELEVLRLIAVGMTNQAIADELFISVKTVARHVSNIFNKLGLSSRAAATAYAYKNGLA